MDGIELAFGADTEHIQTKPFTREVNTELIERFHGTLKDRYKVMRGLKSFESALEYIDGWLVWYNYFRPHESLDGKTPSQAAMVGFPLTGWLDVIKSQAPKVVVPKGTKVKYRVWKKPKKKQRIKAQASLGVLKQ